MEPDPSHCGYPLVEHVKKIMDPQAGQKSYEVFKNRHSVEKGYEPIKPDHDLMT